MHVLLLLRVRLLLLRVRMRGVGVGLEAAGAVLGCQSRCACYCCHVLGCCCYLRTHVPSVSASCPSGLEVRRALYGHVDEALKVRVIGYGHLNEVPYTLGPILDQGP